MADTTKEEIVLEVNTKDAKLALEDLESAIAALKKLAQDIGTAMTKALEPFRKKLENLETGIEAMITTLEDATGAVQQLMDEMNTPQALDIISTIIDSLSLVTDIIANADKLLELLETIGKIIDVFLDSIKMAANKTSNWFQKCGGTIAKAFIKIGPKIVAVFSKIGPAIVQAFSSAGAWITGTLVPAIGSALGAIAGALGISVGWLVAIIVAVIAAIVAVIAYWDEIKLFFTDTLPQLWSQFVERIKGIGNAIVEAFPEIVAAIGGFIADCWNGIVEIWNGAAQWMQDHVIQPIIDFFAPIVGWFSQLFSEIWQTVSNVFYNIGVIISGCWEVLVAVWGVVSQWFDANVIQPVAGFFSGLWESVSGWAVDAWNSITGKFTDAAVWFQENVTQPVADFLSGMWEGFVEAASSAWEAVKTIFGRVAGFFADIFGKAWEGVVKVFSIAGEIFIDIKEGILTAFKKIVNGLITGLNAAISIPFNGINSAIGLIRDITILNITPFKALRGIHVPQIPYLAKGAVLPANRPFLAVVGDQRHGTNVETPLATIQQAVTVALDSRMGAMMEVLREMLSEQRATRLSVESIHIGDDMLATAVDRYNRKMAVVYGTGSF